MKSINKTSASGEELTPEEWALYRSDVYDYLFYSNRKWSFDGQSVYFNGTLIHYSDFMKARRGSL